VDARYVQLRERLAEIWDISKSASILAWDQQTKMPARGAAGRAEQLATLGRIAHEKFTDAEVGQLLEQLQGFEEAQPYDSVEASLIRVTRRDWEKARRVPSELRAELTRSSSLALPIWAQARQDSDFATFLPHLRHAIDLRRRYIDCFDVVDEPYDILLDDFERGMKAADVREVFDRLKAEQVPLVAELAACAAEIRRPAGAFPVERQNAF
jgi:carboxypeptidase Taq